VQQIEGSGKKNTMLLFATTDGQATLYQVFQTLLTAQGCSAAPE